MIKHYIRMAWRNAISNKSYSAISLGSLVLGITLFFFISLWIKKELSYDTGFPQANEVFRVETTMGSNDGAGGLMPAVGWPIGKVLATDYPEIASVTTFRDWHPIIFHKNEHFYEDAFYADEKFFSVFGYKLDEGNPQTALVAPYSIVISQRMKEKYFHGETNVVGKTVMVSDSVSYTITGVLRDIASPSHLQFDMLGSLSSYCSDDPGTCQQEYASGWFDINMYNYVRLQPTAKRTAVESKIRDMVQVRAREMVEKTGFKSYLTLRPVEDIYLYSKMNTGVGPIGNIRTVRLFLVIGIFILIIAALNFVNLTTAKSVERAKEIGIKKVLGGNKSRLIAQFLTETALMCFAAAMISIVLMLILLPLYNQLTGSDYTGAEFISGSNLLVLLGMLAVLVPIAGFYPAWVLSGFRPIAVLKGRFSHSFSGTLLRKGLVVTQFAISIAFIIATFVIWKQNNYMQTQELGFNKDRLVVIDVQRVPWVLRHQSIPVLKNALLANAGFEMVTAANAVPGRSGWGSQFAWPEGQPRDAQFSVEYIPVDADYVKTIGLQLKSGRDFIRNSSQDSATALIVNEAAVRSFGWGNANDAIGKKLSTSGKDGIVVGVLKDYHQHGLQQAIRPVVLGMDAFVNVLAVRYTGNTPAAVDQVIKKAWGQVYAGYEPVYRFLDDDFSRQYAKEKKFQDLFGIAAGVSIVIACMGLLGLTIFSTQRRIKEIGVRKVLGASMSSITVLLSLDFLKLVLVAILIAAPAAGWAMHQWLKDFAYRTSVEWWVYVIAGLVSVLVAFVTISFKAVKAALMNPVNSLRTE